MRRPASRRGLDDLAFPTGFFFPSNAMDDDSRAPSPEEETPDGNAAEDAAEEGVDYRWLLTGSRRYAK